MFTERDAKIALQQFAINRGNERAILLEKMMRKGTLHFSSKTYQNTGSSGIDSTRWHKYLGKYFNKGYVVDSYDNVVFNNVMEFLIFLSDYIDFKKGEYECWYSLSKDKQEEYRRQINNIKNRFVQ